MFATVACTSAQGPEPLIGTGVGNQPVLMIGTGELMYVTTARLQKLLRRVHLGKRMACKAYRFVAMVRGTSVDGALGVQRP